MQLYDDVTAVGAQPAPPAAGGAPGYFDDGLPGQRPRTTIRAWILNLIMNEILAPILAVGLAPSRVDGTQLLKAIRLLIQGAGSSYAVDTSGAANTVIVALNPAPAALTDGLVIRALVGHSCTGAATLTCGGLGNHPIYRSGLGLTPGDLVAGTIHEFVWQDDHWDLQSPAPLSAEAISAALYCVDQGVAANALVGIPVPNPTALIDGLTVRVKVAFTNTGASTFTLGGLGTAAITANGIALQAGMLKAGQVCELVYCGGSWDLVSAPAMLEQQGIHLGGDAAGPVSIVFDRPYAAGVVPHVSLSAMIHSPAGVDTAQLNDLPSNTGFTANRRNYVSGTSSDTNAPFLWRVVGPA